MNDAERFHRAALLEDLRAMLAKTGLEPSKLAKRAGVAHTTVNRFLKSPEVASVISTNSLWSLVDVSGIAVTLAPYQSTGVAVPPLRGLDGAALSEDASDLTEDGNEREWLGFWGDMDDRERDFITKIVRAALLAFRDAA